MNAPTPTPLAEPMRRTPFRTTEPRGREVAALRAEYRAAIAAARSR